jgi:flavin reductase (DIM6/NTAB) family NADH-FMN oxidoreductase RutF
MDKFERFSVSFYDQKYKRALAILGSKSGRDTDKIALSGLTPDFVDGWMPGLPGPAFGDLGNH